MTKFSLSDLVLNASDCWTNVFLQTATTWRIIWRMWILGAKNLSFPDWISFLFSVILTHVGSLQSDVQGSVSWGHSDDETWSRRNSDLRNLQFRCLFLDQEEEGNHWSEVRCWGFNNSLKQNWDSCKQVFLCFELRRRISFESLNINVAACSLQFQWTSDCTWVCSVL